MRAAVLALGDLGRSPRTQLHAKALALSGAGVDLVGFSQSRLHLLSRASVAVSAIDESAGREALVRSISLARDTLRALHGLEAPDVILVQTPPAVPSLWCARRYARRRGAKLVFDWHNWGAPLLELRLGKAHPWSLIYRTLERHSAGLADAHLAVTQKMGAQLSRWGALSTTFEDRPGEDFVAARLLSRETLRAGLFGSDQHSLVAMCPTSFTADEELHVLEATVRELMERSPAKHITIVVSGRGDLRNSLASSLAGFAHAPIRVRFDWFEGDRYAQALAAADIGLCLHRSVAGVDFPMKIHDMVGSGLPVAALSWVGLNAQFDTPRHGWTFESKSELASLLLRGAAEPSFLENARHALRASRPETWEEHWQRVARPVLVS